MKDEDKDGFYNDDYVCFSVVIPLYNKEGYIASCLQSVFNQTLRPSEVIVVNDGSTDDSLSVASSFLRRFGSILKIIDKPNTGVSDSRNVGVQAASNQWVALIDADDLWSNSHLKLLGELIREKDGGVLYSSSSIEFIDEEKVILTSKLICPESSPVETWEGYLSSPNRKKFDVNSSSVCIDKNLFSRLGGFSKVSSGEDVELWVKYSVHGKTFMHSGVTAFYRRNVKGSLSVIARKGCSLENYSPTPAMRYLHLILTGEGREDISVKSVAEIRQYLKCRLMTGVKVIAANQGLLALLEYRRTPFYRMYGPSLFEIFFEAISLWFSKNMKYEK